MCNSPAVIPTYVTSLGRSVVRYPDVRNVSKFSASVSVYVHETAQTSARWIATTDRIEIVFIMSDVKHSTPFGLFLLSSSFEKSEFHV